MRGKGPGVSKRETPAPPVAEKRKNARSRNDPDPTLCTAVRTFFTRMNLFLFDHGARKISADPSKNTKENKAAGGKDRACGAPYDHLRGACYKQYNTIKQKSTAVGGEISRLSSDRARHHPTNGREKAPRGAHFPPMRRGVRVHLADERI